MVPLWAYAVATVFLFLTFVCLNNHTSSQPTSPAIKQTFTRLSFSQSFANKTSDLIPPNNRTSSPPKNNSLAFVSYATNDIYACNNLILFHTIREHLTKKDLDSVDFVSIVSDDVSESFKTKLRQNEIKTEEVDTLSSTDFRSDPTWVHSLTKLYIFNLDRYQRVVYADSDAMAVKSLQPLFQLPSHYLYAPRAYWLPQPKIQSTLLVAEPNPLLFQYLLNELQTKSSEGQVLYDMDIINLAFKDTIGILPGSAVMLNGDLKHDQAEQSSAYIGNWTNLESAYKDAFLVHFSESPGGGYGKPWRGHSISGYNKGKSSPEFVNSFQKFWKLKKKLC